MVAKRKKIRIGVVGCGAIGSRIARSIKSELHDSFELKALYDINERRSFLLAKSLSAKGLVKNSLKELIRHSDLVVEAVNAPKTSDIIQQAIKAKRHVLAMSVGKLLHGKNIFDLATRNNCCVLLPSGAIAGLDAIKAASLGRIRNITLSTRKHPTGFIQNQHLIDRGIELGSITTETVLFEGGVSRAVKFFPQNINVAATLALASQAANKITIRIITSPEFTTNSHEIDVQGDFGRILTRTDNVVCPDNPKTSYLAVLSGIQTLKQFSQGLKIGT